MQFDFTFVYFLSERISVGSTDLVEGTTDLSILSARARDPTMITFLVSQERRVHNVEAAEFIVSFRNSF